MQSLLLLIFLGLISITYGYDFNYFVLQWPGSFQDKKTGKPCYPTSGKPASDFSIHGLWPQFNNGKAETSCKGGFAFDASKIPYQLNKTMIQKWPSLKCPPEIGYNFWMHEWEKHGRSCFIPNQNQPDQNVYFQTTINMSKKLDQLLHISLNLAGIKPDGKFYNLGDIQTAITRGIGYAPHLTCNQDTGNVNRLYEVIFCTDKAATRLIHCNVKYNGYCQFSKVEFPIF